MKRSFLKPILILLTIILGISCGSPNEKFISAVEKMETEIISTEQLLQKIDSSKIRAYLEKSTERMQILQEKFRQDTINKETAILISDYAASRKSMKMFLDNYGSIIQEVEYTKDQLEALKSDLKNSAIPEDKFSDYFGNEVKSVEKLKELINNLLQWHDSAIIMYETKNQAIDKLLDTLNPGKNNN